MILNKPSYCFAAAAMSCAPACRAAEALLADMKLGKIRNFGGKLGDELQSMGCTTPGQVQNGHLQHCKCSCLLGCLPYAKQKFPCVYRPAPAAFR